MKFITNGYLIAAVIYGIGAIAIGLYMAISQDHAQIATHAHMNLIGWVSFFLFGLFYHFFGEKVSIRLAQIQFWLAQLSAPFLFLGVWLVHANKTELEPIAAISSLFYAASFVVFAICVFQVTRSKS